MTTDLVLRAQAGDGDAFDALIRAAYDRLFAAAYRIVRDREGAEDAVQDAVVRCWRNLRGLLWPLLQPGRELIVVEVGHRMDSVVAGWTAAPGDSASRIARAP